MPFACCEDITPTEPHVLPLAKCELDAGYCIALRTSPGALPPDRHLRIPECRGGTGDLTAAHGVGWGPLAPALSGQCSKGWAASCSVSVLRSCLSPPGWPMASVIHCWASAKLWPQEKAPAGRGAGQLSACLSPFLPSCYSEVFLSVPGSAAWCLRPGCSPGCPHEEPAVLVMPQLISPCPPARRPGEPS